MWHSTKSHLLIAHALVAKSQYDKALANFRQLYYDERM